MPDLDKPITTQEQLDAIIGDRLKRERESAAKKYADYDELKGRLTDYEKRAEADAKALADALNSAKAWESEKAEMTAKLKEYETSSVKLRVAHETGIPYELAGRLTGENEAAIRKDAESMARFIGGGKTPPPVKSSEISLADAKTAAYRSILTGLTEQ